MGTGMVPEHIRAPEGCPGTYGHQNRARIIIGTGRVPAWPHMGKYWEMCPGKYWHLNGARADKGTGIEPENVWPPERYLGTYGNWNGARADMGTRRVP